MEIGKWKENWLRRKENGKRIGYEERKMERELAMKKEKRNQEAKNGRKESTTS